jgi:hypothetical protein
VLLASGCVWISSEHHAEALDGDGDGVSVFDECDDTDPHSMAGICPVFADIDGDGFGAGEVLQGCPGPGRVTVDGDCDDLDPQVHPGAIELCDVLDVDEDCDGGADDADPDGATGGSVWFMDEDGDGVGADATVVSCDGGPRQVAAQGDCDDDDPLAFPGAVERCDGVRDENCDGDVDEEGALGALAWFIDDDGDGFGDPFAWIQACQAPLGTVENALDCDDSAAYISPAATERCDVGRR